MPDIEFVAIGSDRDHVHTHMIIPPKYAVSKVVEILKSNTSRKLKEKFKNFLSQVYWDEGGIWSVGYFVSTVGADQETIRRYVENQGKEDMGQALPAPLL